MNTALWLDTAQLDQAITLLRNHASWMDSCREPDQADAARETAERLRQIIEAAKAAPLRDIGGPLRLRCIEVTVRETTEIGR